jgi:hypothetical protein
MIGTIIWVKLPSPYNSEDQKKIRESFDNALAGNLEKDDRIIFTTGDIEIKCFNGNFIELSEEEREELISKLLK